MWHDDPRVVRIITRTFRGWEFTIEVQADGEIHLVPIEGCPREIGEAFVQMICEQMLDMFRGGEETQP